MESSQAQVSWEKQKAKKQDATQRNGFCSLGGKLWDGIKMLAKFWGEVGLQTPSTVFCKHSVNFRQGNSVCAHVSLR